MTRECAICGKEFEGRTKRDKYCSDECRKTVARARLREWRRAHREEILAYNREYYQAHRKEIYAHQCKWRRAHREEVSAYSRKYYQAHREEILARHRERRKGVCPYNEDCLNCPNEGGCLFE